MSKIKLNYYTNLFECDQLIVHCNQLQLNLRKQKILLIVITVLFVVITVYYNIPWWVLFKYLMILFQIYQNYMPILCRC